MKSLLLAAVMTVTPAMAHAVDIHPRCPLTSKLHDEVLNMPGGSWQALPHNVFLFLQGAYYATPPQAFPKGDSAVLAKMRGENIVYFIDGAMACSPFHIPDVMVQAFGSVANGEVFHDESGERM